MINKIVSMFNKNKMFRILKIILLKEKLNENSFDLIFLFLTIF